jgi:flagellar basal-body rod protein FlgF
MDNAQLVSLSRQIALQRQMDIVANNLANINTTGFKAENVLFATAEMPQARDTSFSSFADQPLAFTEDWSTIHDLGAGAITQTGDPLDVALSGNGFLVVDTPNGERYTRDGALTLDSTGTLVDLDGNPVLGESGPIRFTPDETDISITANGSILTPAGSKGKLRLVEFTDPQQLVREGNNLFSGGTPLPATATTVVQGAIERSNVSGVAGMTEMIRVSRAYQTIANLMEQQDETRRSAIEQLGGLRA